MANLSTIRADVLARINAFRPTSDYPIPMSLVDYIVFGVGGMLIEQYRRRTRTEIVRVMPWMMTTLTCQVPKLNTPTCSNGKDCLVSYYLDLPFELAAFQDNLAVHEVYIQDSRLPFKFLPKSKWGIKSSLAHFGRDYMGYSLDDSSRIYFIAGDRNLSKVKITVRAVAGGPRKELVDTSGWSTNLSADDLSRFGYEYSDEVNVAFPPNGRAELVDQAALTIMTYLRIAPDLEEDGKLEKQNATQQ